MFSLENFCRYHFSFPTKDTIKKAKMGLKNIEIKNNHCFPNFE